MRYPLLSFSSTLLVTEESGGCIGSSPLSVANQNRKTHGRHSHYTHETRTRIYKQTPRRTKPPTASMAADIRGARYDGSFRIPPGGVAYPSRPGDSRLGQFPTLGGDDSTIRQQFPSWNRIVQASMKAKNLSQLHTHGEYDDTHMENMMTLSMKTLSTHSSCPQTVPISMGGRGTLGPGVPPARTCFLSDPRPWLRSGNRSKPHDRR